MTATLCRTTWLDCWPAYRLENETIRIEVVPDLGGKIVSLDSLRTGRSWLWRNPVLPVRAAAPGASYVVDHDVGGWDEMFPTVHPCRAPGSAWDPRTLTDHGELWYRAWDVVEPETIEPEGPRPTIALRVEIPSPRLRFGRSIRLDPRNAILRMDYRLDNLGDDPIPYIWAAHPLFNLEPGMRIALPTGTAAVCTAAIGDGAPVVGERFDWPWAPLPCGGELDLSRIGHGSEIPGRAVKAFASWPADGDGWVRLNAPGGEESLRIALRGDEVRHLGLWINERGWAGAGTTPYLNLGIEPSTSPGDRLDDAIASATASSLGPGEFQRWSLEVSIGQWAFAPTR